MYLFCRPNHQIIECYIVFREMEDTKKMKGTQLRHYGEDEDTGVVCAGLSCHQIFEKWRIRDVERLVPEAKLEYERDVQESNRRYDAAFAHVLSYTPDAELSAFWKPFGFKNSSRDLFFPNDRCRELSRQDEAAAGDQLGSNMIENPMQSLQSKLSGCHTMGKASEVVDSSETVL
jgi:hypothetical protein